MVSYQCQSLNLSAVCDSTRSPFPKKPDHDFQFVLLPGKANVNNYTYSGSDYNLSTGSTSLHVAAKIFSTNVHIELKR